MRVKNPVNGPITCQYWGKQAAQMSSESRQIQNKYVEQRQRYPKSWGLLSKTVLFIGMTENNYFNDRYFIRGLKDKAFDLNIIYTNF